MANIYKNAKAIVHPFRGEGFGMHIQEAVACGCYPIFSNSGPVNEFIPQAHILKVSDDELEFITGITNQADAIQSLFKGHVKVIILTKGSAGASVYTKDHSIFVPTMKVQAVDTTGAGDSFIGAIIYQILKHNSTSSTLDLLLNDEIIRFAHKVSGIVVQQKGAIPAMPTIDKLN